MKKSYFYLVVSFLLLQTHYAHAATLNNLDSSNLISAIEDYKFSDYDTAIPALENLYEKSPENPDVLQYLALSYEEKQLPKKSIPVFEAWLSINQNDISEKARFAWIGLANAYIKAGDLDKSASLLKQWIEANPSDIQSQISLGDVLIRQKEYEASNQVWDNILKNNDSNVGHQAAAWYYKAWVAYLYQDIESTTTYAQKSLVLDGQGPYASAAKRLEESPSQKRLGFKGFASLEAFYNSNVKLLPDNSSEHGGDKTIQANVVLGWSLPKIDLNYILSVTKHEDFSNYDLLVHILSASWEKDATWRFKPSYELVTLDTDPLYQSFGLGVFYTQKDWIYQYALKLKDFNNAYGASNVNLKRLGGSSHRLSATTSFDMDKVKLLFSPHFAVELTKGDAAHNKSDNYYQLGGHAIATMPLMKNLKSQVKVNFHSRLYAAADTTILLNNSDSTKRNDLFFKVDASTSWKPWDAYDVSFVVHASYLKNSSNYNDSRVNLISAKDYSAWGLGTMLTGQW